MREYPVQQLRVLIGAHWFTIDVDAGMLLALELPALAADPEAGAADWVGRWEVTGLSALPATIADGAIHEVAITTDDGQCWSGRGAFASAWLGAATIRSVGSFGPC
jgi:hypothetical protein